MSRSFGDLAYKRLGLSSVPDVKVFNITAPRDRFLLLGCDGFWGIFGADDAVQFASAELGKGSSAKHTCSRLINEVCPDSIRAERPFVWAGAMCPCCSGAPAPDMIVSTISTDPEVWCAGCASQKVQGQLHRRHSQDNVTGSSTAELQALWVTDLAGVDVDMSIGWPQLFIGA